MRVYTIEVAEAVENEFKKFLKDWGGGYPMRFTRFVDLGGKQTDLYVYSAEKGSSPWLILRVKSVFKNDQGECMQYFVEMPATGKRMEEVMVSPEIWKLPALSDKVLTFAKNDLLVKIGEGGAALGGGVSSLGSGFGGKLSAGAEDEEDLDDFDTSGILASDSNGGGSDFNPEDIIAQANQASDEEDFGFNPEDVIKD